MRPWTLSLLPLALAACATSDTGDTADKDTADSGDTDTGDTDTGDTGDTGDTDTGDTAAVDEDLDGHSPPEDCNDADAAVNPAATEVCNGTDDNCDGQVDEGTGGTWYGDADRDGYGDGEVWACDQPPDTSSTGGDCDDADASVYPGAAEVCDDGVVNDCAATEADARAACPVEWPAAAGSLDGHWTEDHFEGSAGAAVALGDLDGDGLADALVGAPYADGGDERQYAGRAYVVLGSAGTTGTLSSVAAATISGTTPYQSLGQAVAVAADLDGDGLDDVLVGAPNTYQEGAGAYVFLGGLSGALDPSTAAASFVNGGGTGTAVSGAGDLDGDGRNDFMVGNPLQQNEGYVGQVDLFSGTPAGSLTAAGWIRGQASAGGQLGTAVASAGDYDGDGLMDIVAGAPGQAAAFVILGATTLPAAEVQDVSALSLSSADTDGALGQAVAGVGDVDGDGLDDVAVGAPDEGAEYEGSVVIVAGGTTGALASTSAAVVITGATRYGFAGQALGAAGDVDGDGLADLLVGAPGDWNEGSFQGSAYLVLGGASGAVDLASPDAVTTGDARSDGFGTALAAGDRDGDGRPDVLGGARGDGEYGGAYLLLGPTTW